MTIDVPIIKAEVTSPTVIRLAAGSNSFAKRSSVDISTTRELDHEDVRNLSQRVFTFSVVYNDRIDRRLVVKYYFWTFMYEYLLQLKILINNEIGIH